METVNDYIHLYIGSEAKVSYYTGGYNVEVSWDKPKNIDFELAKKFKRVRPEYKRLYLRNLDSMNEVEHDIYIRLPINKGFLWALSKGFDIFNLIEKGLALDIETIKK